MDGDDVRRSTMEVERNNILPVVLLSFNKKGYDPSVVLSRYNQKMDGSSEIRHRIFHIHRQPKTNVGEIIGGIPADSKFNHPDQLSN